MSAQELRACPVCGGQDHRLVHSQRFMSGPLGNGYNVVVCKQCGAGFADKTPLQSQMDHYYADHSKYAYEHTAGAESPWDFIRFEKTAEQVSPHLLSREIHILDVGCATGGLLSVFKKRGFKNLLGADPSPACAATAERLYGVEVRAATLAQMADWDERFDLILMVGVLEHLREAKDAVNVVSRLLNHGGSIYCAVPNVEGLADCVNAPYQQFSIEHVNFFSHGTLKRLMRECGMGEIDAWKWTVDWRENITEPIVSGLYRRKQTQERNDFDTATGAALDRYLAFSYTEDQKIVSVIDSLVRTQEPILVWGAGTLARRLLATTRLAEAKIAAFVDSNSHFHGQVLAGRPILGPNEIASRRESILVCSVCFAQEITSAIRMEHKFSGRLISFPTKGT